MQINIICIVIALFVIGAISGSFGGVLISRKWDKKGIKSIFFGRSKCINCDRTLGFMELIPVLSFWMQGGKCRNCKIKLDNLYWIVEVFMGVVFVLTYLYFPYINIGELVFWILINWALVLLLIFDIQKYELHLPIWIFVTTVSLVFAFIKLDLVIFFEIILAYVCIFLAIYVFSKYYMRLRFKKQEEGFGQGDIYLSLTIGALSGFVFYYNIVEFSIINLIDLLLIYVILSSVLGLIYALFDRFVSNRNKQLIPFLPAMILAFWALLLFGDVLIGVLH